MIAGAGISVALWGSRSIRLTKKVKSYWYQVRGLSDLGGNCSWLLIDLVKRWLGKLSPILGIGLLGSLAASAGACMYNMAILPCIFSNTKKTSSHWSRHLPKPLFLDYPYDRRRRLWPSRTGNSRSPRLPAAFQTLCTPFSNLVEYNCTTGFSRRKWISRPKQCLKTVSSINSKDPSFNILACNRTFFTRASDLVHHVKKRKRDRRKYQSRVWDFEYKRFCRMLIGIVITRTLVLEKLTEVGKMVIPMDPSLIT